MSQVTSKRLGVIGAGVMGQALLKGLLEKKRVDAKQVWAAAKSQSTCQQVTQELGIEATTNYTNLLTDTNILLLCVKPAGINKVLAKLKSEKLSPDTLIISIAAGNTLENMEAQLGGEYAIVRAMPNTPCIVGQGMTAVCGGTYATPEQVETTKQIFEAVGQCLVLDETHFDAVTGLGGSGPAYLYLIMEALADGGVRVGLPRDIALKIVSQTVLGAATMVQQSGRHPASLRDDVTTPAGCTIAGLLMMEDGKIRSVLARAVEEAAMIAGQLGKS